MMQFHDEQALKDYLDNFPSIFEIIRFVNPFTYQFNMIYPKITPQDNICYKFWKKEKPCDNCTSLLAYNTDTINKKIEYNGEKIYLVISLPVLVNNEKKIIELLTDITEVNVYNIEGRNIINMYNEVIKLSKEVHFDSLTSVYNRRFLDENLSNELRASKIFSLILADIDHFKLINDQFGHLAGDEVLKRFAQILQNNIRNTKDWVARYGGEEFLIFLCGVSLEQAKEIAERIREEVEKTVVKYENYEIKFTASFGVTTFNNKSFDATLLLKQVDENMYTAKKTGRNKVIADI